MEGVLVCVHVQGIDRKLVCAETKRSEHFSEGQVFPVSEDDNILSRGENERTDQGKDEHQGCASFLT
jgi:hypothetical protein